MKQRLLPGGDLLRHDNRAMIIELKGPRRVLSTSFLNGGFREDLAALFNFSEVYGVADERCEMRAPTNEGHLAVIAEELGLAPETAAGLSTAAKMKYLQVKSVSYDDFTLTAAVTAGIDVSGNRVGDPSYWHEKDGIPIPEAFGTINIVLHIDALLAPGALARALSICTEAKTAALQEVLAQSCFSKGLATGSGTDGTIVVCRLDSPVRLSNAGTHSKLGEHIGRLVKETVIDALVAENGFRSYARGSLLKRVSRFGIDEERIWDEYLKHNPSGNGDREQFRARFSEINKNEAIILQVTLLGHLIDLLQWNMADPAEVIKAAEPILSATGPLQSDRPAPDRYSGLSADALAEELIKLLTSRLALNVKKGRCL